MSQAKPALKQLNLNKLSDAGGSQKQGLSDAGRTNFRITSGILEMKLIEGIPDPLGFSIQKNGANFALFSSHAQKVTLGLFQDNHLLQEIPMHRSQDIWHIGIENLEPNLEYAYRCEGPKEHLYRSEAWLIDPYAKIVRSGRAVAALPPLFDWQKDTPPRLPKENLILYEMHVRGFTQHSSAASKHPGTYLGIIEKIPHLKKLGVNAIELMPIFGFDQHYIRHTDPTTHQKLLNYWGYNPLHFFFPMEWYAEKDPIVEFKTLVREMHKSGIEVILDVVYNHTGEEDDPNYYVHFRGIDNCVYYLLSPEGKYLNFSGCWNTLNANHPVVQKLILDSLCYWVEEMHVDGFRFDLASILTRDPMGNPVASPPLLEAIQQHPILKEVKLIAEAWDAAGLYQLGEFPRFGPWSEWNGIYRDTVRRFIKGTEGHAGLFATALSGSEPTYHSSGTPLSSVNFVTAHDGYSLRDLVSYQQKHNLANGENNCDGTNVNDSWNCGQEGPTDDPQINALRERQMRNFFLALLVSQGIPMLLMGDEYGHTRRGNNNPYGQDNELNWFLWNQIDPKKIQFLSSLIALRLRHPQFRRTKFLDNADVQWNCRWDDTSRFVAYQLLGTPSFYIAFNANFQPQPLHLPSGEWRCLINTAEDWTVHETGSASPKELLPFSAILLSNFSADRYI